MNSHMITYNFGESFRRLILSDNKFAIFDDKDFVIIKNYNGDTEYRIQLDDLVGWGLYFDRKLKVITETSHKDAHHISYITHFDTQHEPQFVIKDPTGDIIISLKPGMLHVYDSFMVFKRVIYLPDNFQLVYGMSFTTNGDYILWGIHHHLLVITPHGDFIKKLLTPFRPVFATMDYEGYFYICHFEKKKIYLYDHSLKQIKTINLMKHPIACYLHTNGYFYVFTTDF